MKPKIKIIGSVGRWTLWYCPGDTRRGSTNTDFPTVRFSSADKDHDDAYDWWLRRADGRVADRLVEGLGPNADMYVGSEFILTPEEFEAMCAMLRLFCPMPNGWAFQDLP